MRTILTTLLILVLTQLKAQNMEQPKDVVTHLFVATDQNQWNKVENCFANEVLLDYSSMGNPTSKLTPNQITNAWKIILPGFTHTHHQIGNIQEVIEKDKSEVFAYGTATHYLEDENGSVWTVVGTYSFELIKESKQWKVSAMTFNLKYQDGNLSLPQKAINKVAGKPNLPTMGERNKTSVKSFFQALENEDADEVVNLFAENAIHINPYHSGIFPEGANGKEAIKNYWEPVFPNFDGMTFPVDEIYAMEDPSIVYVKYTGNIKLKNNAGVYSNNYYSTFKFDEEGKITEYVEIFNPITAARGFGLLDKIK
ncbi:MAG: nuclear transport factor 2 family protein [Ekhidna sp.]|nr:nuclear transport factor 2 family protein [Ekhidna sp.]